MDPRLITEVGEHVVTERRVKERTRLHVADRRGVPASDAPAAEGASLVGRVDLDVVGKGQDLVSEGIAHGGGEGERLLTGAEEIRTRDVPDEEGAAGEEQGRLRPAVAVGHEKTDVLRGMAGGVESLDQDLAQFHSIPIVKRPCPVT